MRMARACAAWAAAWAAALLAALVCSERFQALFIFLWFVDLPAVDWERPTVGFPCRSKARCQWDDSEAAWIPQSGAKLPFIMFWFRGVRAHNATAVRIEARQGVQLGAWVMHGFSWRGRGGGRTLLYAHGTAGNRAVERRVILYELLLSDPAYRVDTVVAFDYAGFGDSGGGGERASDVSEARVVDDMLAADAWVREHLRPRQLVWWGTSLGTGVALGAIDALAQRAGRALPDALVLEAPFTSIADVAALRLGPLARWIVHRFESLPRAARRIAPTLVLHGTRDAVIPISQVDTSSLL